MKVVFSILLVLCFSLSKAQVYSFNFSEDVKHLKKDLKGNVYIVGNQSLCRFDGKEAFRNCVYTDQQITDVVVISQNNFFIAIEDRLIHYNNLEQEQEFQIDEVITRLEYVNNHLLIGTLGKGLFNYSISDKTIKHIIEDGFINDIDVNHKNALVITDDTVFQLDEKLDIINYKRFNQSLLKQIATRSNADIALLTGNGHLYILNNSLNIINHDQFDDFSPKQIVGNTDYFYAIDEHSLRQWDKRGFTEIKKGKFEHIIQDSSLLITSHKKTISTHEIVYKVFDNIDKVFSVFAEDHAFWLGREGKISKFQGSKVTREIVFPEKHKNTYVSSIVIHKNKIYAGTMGKGILIFNKTNGRYLEHFQSETGRLNEQNVIQLQIKDHILWIGYLNGLKGFDLYNNHLKYDFSSYLKNNYLYRFHINNIDDILLCTSDAGLIHLKDGAPKNYLKGHSIYSLEQSPQGIIFSAEDNGIYLLNDSLTKLSDQYFFRNKNIYNILQVGSNTLFSHDSGVDLLNIEDQTIHYLTKQNLNEAHLNANAVGGTKALIGYDNGFIVFDVKLLKNTFEDHLILKPPLLFNTPIASEQNEFDFDENTWTFAYETKNYRSPNNTYYKYRLKPIESDWKSTNQDNITYYNLPSGTYSFELSSGGHRNFKPTLIKNFNFHIAKPLWKKLYFWVLCILLLSVLIYFYIRHKENQIKKKEALKNIQLEFEYQRLKDQINPHFLFNSFNSIIGVVEEDPKKGAKTLVKLSSLYRSVLKHEKTEVIPVAEEIDLAMKYFEIHKLRFQDLIQLNIVGMARAENRFIIPFSLQLLIENAIKHNVINSKHRLRITIYEEDDYLVVSNTLNQKQGSTKSMGLGINNLMKRHEMRLSKLPVIEKTATEFIVKIPLIYG